MARQQGRTTDSGNVEGFLRWTDAMRQRTHGRRGSWHAPLEMDEKGIIERLAEPENRKWLEKFRFDEACAPFRQRIIETPRDRLYSLEDDPCLEGVRAAVYRLAFKHTIVPWWCREKGAAFASGGAPAD